MTISVDKYQDKYFETYLAVDPDTLRKIPGPIPPITPLWLVFLMVLAYIGPPILILTAIILLIRRRKSKLTI